ncbi:metal-dependent transcriptional regulator [Salarchaeum sp. JOR-1]|uniref:metal-dependent transcriptional regulator n=1 Tax=Salarchaeum sp. JOR-1 TaxID=2599399 RepID=UPI0011982C3A|nr:metal-dependent transcriptional regulator [Salarchaeum sp. JOR-1]QDX40031.1 metal-dependent transcriptional regulator [Salarchaeum sp. JOR-1]
MSPPTVSESEGRYLSAILLVSETAGRPAKTGELADELDVSPASVTERIGTLADRGLVAYERYEGATLTETGEDVTRELLWKRCLAENLVDEAEADVEAFGHALSEDVAAALKSFIDHPCSGECRAPDAEYSECQSAVRESVSR